MTGELQNEPQYSPYPQQPLAHALPAYPPHAPSPTVAALLGFIPGAGALYNGQFTKALVHLLAFASFIWMAASGYGLFGGLMIAFSVLYMVADAYKTAEARQYGLPVPDPFGLATLFGETHVRAGAVVSDPQRTFPAGAVILIAIGGLFLLRTLSIWRPDFDRFWPVILIVIGVILLLFRIPWKKDTE